MEWKKRKGGDKERNWRKEMFVIERIKIEEEKKGRKIGKVWKIDEERMEVKIEEKSKNEIIVGIDNRMIEDKKSIEKIKIEKKLLLRIEEVEIKRSRKKDSRKIGLMRSRIIGEEIRINKRRRKLMIGKIEEENVIKDIELRIEIGGRKKREGEKGERILIFKKIFMKGLRKEGWRMEEIEKNNGKKRIREGNIIGRVIEIGKGEVLGKNNKRNVEKKIGGWSEIEDIEENEVKIGIGMRKLMKESLKKKRERMLIKIGEMEKRNLVKIELRRR